MPPGALINRRAFRLDRSSDHESPVDELLRITSKETREIQDAATLKRRSKRKTPYRRYRLRLPTITEPDSADVVAAVVVHQDFAKIESLEIVDSFVRLSHSLITALRDGHLAHLRHLKLAEVSSSCLTAVFETLPKLQVLELSNLKIEDAELASLIRTNRLSSLVRLDLTSLWKVGNETAAAIASGALPALENLELGYVSIGDAGLRALAEGTALGRLKKLSYSTSVCGTSLGLDVKLSEAAMPALNKISECVDGVFFNLDLEEAPLALAADLRADMEPSLDAFRSIWLALEADPSGLEAALARLAAWPPDVRIPPPYAINHLVDGRAPRALLRLAHGLRIFDLALDEATNMPLPYAASDAQIAKLVAWLGTLEDEAAAVEVVDASAEAWLTKLDPNNGTVSATFFGMTSEGWSLLLEKFRGVRVLNLSYALGAPDVRLLEQQSHWFESLTRFPRGMHDELVIEELLAEAPLSSGLKELYLQGYGTAMVLNPDGFPTLPSLEVLDLSGHLNRHEAKDLGPRLPSLQRLILDGDSFVRYALDKGDPEVVSDYGFDSAAKLEELLLSDADIAAIREAIPSLKELVLGGEVGKKRVGKKKHGKLVVRDAQRKAERRWLVW